MGDVAVIEPAVDGGGTGPGDSGPYAALRTGAVWFDRRTRARTLFRGAHAVETVSGLVTNDVKALAVGQGQYAAALTPKGKIVADVRIFRVPEGVLVDAGPLAAEGWRQLVRRYVNPRTTPYTDLSASVADVGIFGARAAVALASALGLARESLMALAPYGSLAIPGADRAANGAVELGAIVLRVPDLGVDGFDLLVPSAGWDGALGSLADANVIAGNADVWTVARIEAGRPEWGVDIDDSTIPQEANFDELGAISYTKGCYTGQETVARIHFRGHVNRHLRGLRLAAPVLPAPRAAVVSESGDAAGDVRSATHSPRLGPIALAMLRRELSIGDRVVVRWDALEHCSAGEVSATVTDLPFAPPV